MRRDGTGIASKLLKFRVRFSSARGQFARRLVGMVPAIDFGGALQRFRNAATDILRTNVAFEI